MSSPAQLNSVLTSTGFLIGGKPVQGLEFEPATAKKPASFVPDAIWRDRSSLEVLFKFVPSPPDAGLVASWHRDAWNLGVAPLLWLVSPHKIEIYNTFGRPEPSAPADAHLLRTFGVLAQELARLDDYAGRLSMVSGRFWSNEERVRREGRVDQQLLADLQKLENRLCNEDDGLPRNVAQGLLGRCIFIRYLTDRGIVEDDILQEFGSSRLDEILSRLKSAYELFDWVRNTFNGDLFPVTAAERRSVRSKHVKLVAETLAGVSPLTGQGSLWPYKFDVIPIELISSIYEQFAHVENSEAAQGDGLHYTPVSLVNLVLDEVLREIKPNARILDMTCGSGVFLVESLRRLVKLRSGSSPVTRQLIRKTMREQIFGVDKNEAAIRVASFSLYLTALELDPNPRPPRALRFEPLIGRNLFVADALSLPKDPKAAQLCSKRFDAIVGNPPWTYSGGEAKLRWTGEVPALPPRSQDFAFVWKSTELANNSTRFGIVMRATPFFSGADASRRARDQLLEKLAPVALVNLSALRDELFQKADYPAVVLFARLHNQKSPAIMPVISVPWTSTFSGSGAFEISPSDVRLAPLKEIRDRPEGLKSFAIGTPRDWLLLRRLSAEMPSAREVLDALDLKPLTGVQLLAGDQNDASHLIGLPLLVSGELSLWIDTRPLPNFTKRRIHRPRDRAAFRAPLVLFAEGLSEGRVPVGISQRDVVYSRSFYGISFYGKPKSEDISLCMAGILHSAMASWHLLLTASEFGVHKRKVLLQDILRLPFPPSYLLHSAKARAIAAAVRALDAAGDAKAERALSKLDDTVSDLFDLNGHERLIVQEGLARAKREYVQPRLSADRAIPVADLDCYAQPFLEILNAWSGALGKGRYDAEVFKVRPDAPLRIVRFVRSGSGKVRVVGLSENLNEAVAEIGKRIRLPIAERLAAVRELRVHGEDELFIIKPAARRYWSPAAGLNDADAALGDGLGADRS